VRDRSFDEPTASSSVVEKCVAEKNGNEREVKWIPVRCYILFFSEVLEFGFIDKKGLNFLKYPMNFYFIMRKELIFLVLFFILL